MILSGKPELEFQAEIFVRSLDLFGKVNYCFTICRGANKINSILLRKKAEIIQHSGDDWMSGLSCVPSKGDITIYTDTDIMICSDLNPLLQKCKEQIGGVIAYTSPKIDWNKLPCGLIQYKHPLGGKCPYYINLGFVAVPTKFITKINETIPKFLKLSDEIYPGHYHKPQFAMCLTIENLRLPKITLPLVWNMPDLFPEIFNKNAKVMHLLATKSKVNSWNSIRHYKAPTKYQEIVHEKLLRISRMVF